MFRRILAAAGAALALFHVWLFAGQAVQGELADPARLIRWAVACALLGALYGLYRSGVPLLRGRKAIAIWLLAALLHAPAIGARVSALEIPAVPEAAASLAPLATLAAAALAVFLLLWIARVPRGAFLPRHRDATHTRRTDAGSPGAYHPLCPRPPPYA